MFRILFVFAGVLLFSSFAGACSCAMSQPPEESLEAADAVFAGTVTDIADPFQPGSYHSTAADRHVTFNVSEVWKGPDYESIVVSTAVSSASCGYSFSEDEDYLVYARGAEDELSVSLCSRTAVLDEAEEDIAALGSGDAPAMQGQNYVPLSSSTLLVGIVAGIAVFISGAFLVFRRYHQ